MRSPLLNFALAALVILAAGCSSSTVIEASAGDAAPSSATASDTSESAQAADEPTAIPTSVPPTPVPEEENTEQEQEEDEDESSLDGYNPEAQWAALADLCRSDDTRACDVLFLISPIDSDYETLASTCNGAGVPNSGWCTDGVQQGLDDLSFDEASPALDGIAEECTDGDMMACDFLYFGSPTGGEWEAFGDGCGGRTDSAFPDCRTEYGDNG